MRRGRKRAALVGCALVLACLAPACAGKRWTTGCTESIGAEDWEAAARRCERAFRAKADLEAGSRAARAHLSLGNWEEVVRWRERLRGTPQERYATFLAGHASLQLADYERAEETYGRLVEIAERDGHAQRLIDGHYGLGMSHWGLTRYRPAIEHLTVSYRLALEREERGRQARALSYLGGLLRDIGDDRGARWALERLEATAGVEDPRALNLRATIDLVNGEFQNALETFRRLRDKELRRGFRRAVLTNMLEAHVGLGQIEEAEKALEQAAALVAPDETVPVAQRMFRARILALQGRHEEALAEIDGALTQDVPIDYRWQLQHDHGRAARRLGRDDAAIASLEGAIATIERMRADAKVDDFKARLLELKREPYEDLFDLHAEAGRFRDALAVLERGKARAIVDAISATRTARSMGGDWTPDPAIERLARLEQILPAVNVSALAAPRTTADLLSVPGLPPVLDYFRTVDRYWLAIVDRGNVAVLPLEGDAAEIDRLAETVARDPSDETAATDLGDRLFPSESMPPAGTPLALAPDGSLKDVSFAAMRVDGRRLVERHPISIVPSLTAVAVAREQRDEATSAPALVAGNPGGDLFGAEVEAMEVAAALGTKAHTGVDVSIEWLLSRPPASLLHLATHAGIGEAGGWLELSDGVLHAAEIVRAGLAPRIVVLAGCQTAMVDNRGLWGSLATSFLVNGSEAVIATQWPIDDATSSRFVREFYAAGGATRPVVALARVQAEWIARGVPVRDWAPFVVFGSPIAGGDSNDPEISRR